MFNLKLSFSEFQGWYYTFKYSGIEVEKIISIESFSTGDIDGPDWVAIGKLSVISPEPEWFVVRGYCSYTGWSANGWGEYETASTKEELIMQKLSSEERTRLLTTQLLREDPSEHK